MDEALRPTTPARGGHAPIALFVFRRPEHARRALEALARNCAFGHSPLHVFCDAARSPAEAADVERTRQVVRDFPHPDKHVVEAARNRGLANSIVEGVTALCERHGRVIVIEDDLLVSPHFLDYMNRALDRHADDERVMQVSGHMYPIAPPDADAVLLPMTTSWGWATWQRAWRRFDRGAAGAVRLRRSAWARYRFDLDGSYPYFAMLRHQLAGRSDSWAILWYLTVFAAAGRVLFPRQSLVENVGFDGSGTHCDERYAVPPPPWSMAPLGVDAPSRRADAQALARVKRHLRRERGLVRRLGDWRQRLFAS